MKVGIEMNEKWICAILKMKVKSNHSHLTEKVKLNSKLILKKLIPEKKYEHTGGRLIFVEITFFCLANPD